GRAGRIRRAAAAAALGALSACGANQPSPLHIAIAGPLQQASGRSMRLAAQMAVEEINRAGGIDGRPLALVERDDAASRERAVEVAMELRDDPRVVAVVGHITSAATLAAAGTYNDETNGLVAISPASSSPQVSDAGPWTFRV